VEQPEVAALIAVNANQEIAVFGSASRGICTSAGAAEGCDLLLLMPDPELLDPVSGSL
jgi:hypothetical protein